MNDLKFHIPTQIIYGRGKVERIGILASEYGRRALLVTEEVISQNELQLIRDWLQNTGVDTITYQNIGPGVTSRAVEACMEIAEPAKTQLIIAYGGVKVSSIAKCVALLLAESDVRVDEFIDGKQAFTETLPLLVVPNSPRNPFLCTGEILLTDARNRSTAIYQGPVPAAAALIDPDLYGGLPWAYLAASYVNILLLSVEGLLSKRNTFLSQTFFLRSIGAIFPLLRNMREGEDHTEGFSSAAEGGIFCSLGQSVSGVGIASAITYVISGYYKIQKSPLAAVLLPIFLEYFLETSPHIIARLASIVGIESDGGADIPRQVVDTIREVIAGFGLASRLREFEIPHKDLGKIAQQVMSFDLVRHLPVKLDLEKLVTLLEQAY